ncbi:MAG: DUF177 domain-containing protein [Gemmatimonadota bacterium]|nr:DUF177 domain-containing protein [Gemmatimonadota bacterium]
MRISFADLHRGAVEKKWRLETPAEVLGTLPVTVGSLDIEVSARGTPRDGVRVEGRLSAIARCECRRCLDEVRVEIAPALDVWFRVEDEVTPGEDGVWPFARASDGIDLTDAVREEVLLALPDYPVCEEECRGICPSCGARLSEEDCTCPPPEPDERWAALREVNVRKGG